MDRTGRPDPVDRPCEDCHLPRAQYLATLENYAEAESAVARSKLSSSMIESCRVRNEIHHVHTEGFLTLKL